MVSHPRTVTRSRFRELRREIIREASGRCFRCGGRGTELHHFKTEDEPIKMDVWRFVCGGGFDNLPPDSKLRWIIQQSSTRGMSEDEFLDSRVAESEDGWDCKANMGWICGSCHTGKLGYHSEEQRKGRLADIIEYCERVPVPVFRRTDIPDSVSGSKTTGRKLSHLAKDGLMIGIQIGWRDTWVYGYKPDPWVPDDKDEFEELVEINGTELVVKGMQISEGVPVGGPVLEWGQDDRDRAGSMAD